MYSIVHVLLSMLRIYGINRVFYFLGLYVLLMSILFYFLFKKKIVLILDY